MGPSKDRSDEFSHIDEGKAQMVDISDKDDVYRKAVATGDIRLSNQTLDAIRTGDVIKGNVLGTARISGIQAVKKTWEAIPMCHQVSVTDATIEFEHHDDRISVSCIVKSTGKTGVEMEALHGVSVALLTIWDMVKSLEKNNEGLYPSTVIQDVKVVEKTKKKSS